MWFPSSGYNNNNSINRTLIGRKLTELFVSLTLEWGHRWGIIFHSSLDG